MTFTPRDLNVLEGSTFTLPLCVYNKNLNPDIEAFVNWGDGSREKITDFTKTSNYFYVKYVDKKYTFPGTYLASIQIKRNIRDIFNDGFKNVGYYNINVLPTTLTYAPSSNFIITDLASDNRKVNIYMDDSGVPHDFNNKTLKSTIKDNLNNVVGNFVLTYTPSISSQFSIEVDNNLLNALVLNTNYFYSILEVTNTGLSAMILQGLVKKITPSSNGITVS